MDFREATDRLTALCPTLDDVAAAVDRDASSVRKARLSQDSPSYRTPPPEWRTGIAALARRRGTELLRLAEELEDGS